MSRLAIVATSLSLAACAASGPPQLTYYSCEDGSGFNAEIDRGALRLHTATGVIMLPRGRGDEGTLYTNGLRSVILRDDGTARHAIGKRAWVECKPHT